MMRVYSLSFGPARVTQMFIVIETPVGSFYCVKVS
jgi:hypothetical protein